MRVLPGRSLSLPTHQAEGEWVTHAPRSRRPGRCQDTHAGDRRAAHLPPGLGVTCPARTRPLLIGGDPWVIDLARALRTAGLDVLMWAPSDAGRTQIKQAALKLAPAGNSPRPSPRPPQSKASPPSSCSPAKTTTTPWPPRPPAGRHPGPPGPGRKRNAAVTGTFSDSTPFPRAAGGRGVVVRGYRHHRRDPGDRADAGADGDAGRVVGGQGQHPASVAAAADELPARVTGCSVGTVLLVARPAGRVCLPFAPGP
jgi:hypothetical protein